MSAQPMLAADTRVVAFGDSITAGYGDDGNEPYVGYPGRLESALRGQGLRVSIENQGVGGETTSEALSRVGSVLDEGGDVFLLMEGTNDIYRWVSAETIRFNLNALAARAEARGMTAVHATVVPHRPDGYGDNDNLATRDVQLTILDLAAQQGRPVVDAFSVFWDEPDFAARYYLDAPSDEDPVGHPNASGYDLLADAFFDPVRSVLQSSSGSGQITVLTDPIVAGQAASFEVDLNGAYLSVLWHFGNEGWAAGRSANGYRADFVFDRPGTYPVSVQAVSPTGRTLSSLVEVTVQGPAPSWLSAHSVLPLARRSQPSPAGTRRRTELRLVNTGFTAARVEIELLGSALTPREAELRSGVGPIAVGLRAGASAVIPDLLPLLGVADGVASLRLTSKVAAGAFGPKILGSARVVTQDAAGEREEIVGEAVEAAWGAGTRSVGALDADFGADASVAISNPGTASASVTLDLLDATGAPAGSASVALPPGSTALRALPLLFPVLLTDPGPFALRVFSGAARVVAGLEGALPGSDDRSFVAMPVEAAAPSVLYLPTLGSSGDGRSRRLMIHNPGSGTLQLNFSLLRPDNGNAAPPSSQRTLDPGQSLVVDEPRSSLFHSSDGAGTLRIEWSGSLPPVVIGTTGRASPSGGVLGAALRASGGGGLLGEQAVLDLPVPGSLWTSRLGLIELAGEPVTVSVELYDLLGQPLSIREIDLHARELVEWNLSDLFPGLEGEVGCGLSLWVGDGPEVLGYLTSEAPSGDLSVVLARSTITF